jgi:hypothetical protein
MIKSDKQAEPQSSEAQPKGTAKLQRMVSRAENKELTVIISKGTRMIDAVTTRMVSDSDDQTGDYEHEDGGHQNGSSPNDRTRHAGMVVWIHTCSSLQALEIASIGHCCEDWTISRVVSESENEGVCNGRLPKEGRKDAGEENRKSDSPQCGSKV